MDLEAEAARRVGTTLCNKWTLERLIGIGGMAAVYVAQHKIGRREAIKILHPDLAREAELCARFEQEAHAVNRFKHPGAVEIRDIDVAEDGSPFLVMELLEGEPLSTVARRPGGIDLPTLLRYVDELLDVLVAAHAQGIVHRDVKPANLFVLTDGRLKVLDFGIARVREPREGKPTKLRTRAGAALGTAPYMPPEQIKGLDVDGRADIFATGAMMFRLIAHRRIHEAATEPETLVKMANEPAPALASVAPTAPPDVCLVVDRALMFDRAQRYPDAATMQTDVRALRDGKPPPYAHAQLLLGTPPPSALRVPAVLLPAAAPPPDGSGVSAAVLLEPTAAASPVAVPPSAEPAAPPSSAVPTPEATTRTVPERKAAPPAPVAEVTPVSGAAARAAAVTPPADGVFRAPGAGTTLRSEPGAGTDGAPVRPHGFVVPPEALLPPQPRPAGSNPGPRTQPAGAEPLSQRPGSTVPVVAAPPRPPLLSLVRAALPPNLAMLIVVGVAFAAIGVGVTLWWMGSDAAPASAPAPSAEPTEPAEMHNGHPASHAAPHGAAPQHPGAPASSAHKHPK